MLITQNNSPFTNGNNSINPKNYQNLYEYSIKSGLLSKKERDYPGKLPKLPWENYRNYPGKLPLLNESPCN